MAKVGEAMTEDEANEAMFSKFWNEPCYISFYSADGHPFRETMYSERNHMDNILHRQANKMAKKLGADHWAVFKHWSTFYTQYTREEQYERDNR